MATTPKKVPASTKSTSGTAAKKTTAKKVASQASASAKTTSAVTTKITRKTSATAVKPAAPETSTPKAKKTRTPAAKKTAPQKVAVSPEQRYHMISTAAYFLAERRGFAGGYEMQDWITAEAEIDARLNP